MSADLEKLRKEYRPSMGAEVLHSWAADVVAALSAAAQPAAGVKTLHKDGEPITLADCPVGLFYAASGELCLKSEYGSNEGRIDAYIVSTGEFFWGAQPQTIASQRAQLVRPVLPTAQVGECSEAGAEALRKIAALRYAEDADVYDTLDEALNLADAALATPPSSAQGTVERAEPNFAETLNFYISDAESGLCRVPRQKMVEIQAELRRLAVDSDALRELVERAQGLMPSVYVNWHTAARAALSSQGRSDDW